MWELDHKESWVPKNWCFWTVALEKTFESPLGCKEIKPVPPKGNQSGIFIERIDTEAETPILWPPDAKNWLICKVRLRRRSQREDQLQCPDKALIIHYKVEVLEIWTNSWGFSEMRYEWAFPQDRWGAQRNGHWAWSVQQGCRLCEPMDCSTPGYPVLHYLLEFAQSHVHWVGDAIQPSHPLSPPPPPALSLSQHQGLFQWVHSLHQVNKAKTALAGPLGSSPPTLSTFLPPILCFCVNATATQQYDEPRMPWSFLH